MSVSDLFDFTSQLSIQPLEWPAVASQIEKLRTTFAMARRFQEKVDELVALLEPSWTQLSLHTRSKLEHRISTVTQEIAVKRPTANGAMALVPSNIEIFGELWKEDGFYAWQSPLARSILERFLGKIALSSVQYRGFRAAVKSDEFLWKDWDRMKTDSQVRVLVSLFTLNEEIEALRRYAKKEHERPSFPRPPTLEELRQAALSSYPIQRIEQRQNGSTGAVRRRRRKVQYRAGNHQFEGFLHVRPQPPSQFVVNARQADSPNPSIFAPPSSTPPSDPNRALLQHLGTGWNHIEFPHVPLVGSQPQAEPFPLHFNDFTAHGTPAFPPLPAHDATPHYPSATYASSSSASRSGVQHFNPQQSSHGSQFDFFDPKYPEFPYNHHQ